MSKQQSMEALNNLLSTEKDTRWREKAEYRQANKHWLKKSAKVAIKLVRILRAKGLSQKELAERIGVSAQYVSKIVKGRENLSLETISKLELALGVELISILREDEVIAKASSQTLIVKAQEVLVRENANKLAAIAHADQAYNIKQNLLDSFSQSGDLLKYTTVTVYSKAGEELDYSSQAA